MKNIDDTSGAFEDLVKLSFFSEIGKAITSADSLKRILDEVMEKIGMIFAPSYWSLLLTDRKTGDLVFEIVTGKNADKLKGQRVHKGEGVAGWIAETGHSVVVEDVKKDSRFSNKIDSMTGFQTESIVGVPLKTEKRVFGVIELINKIDGEPFTPFDLKLLSTIADFAAIALEKVFYFKAYHRMAIIDPLTEVYNRRHFERILAREIERSNRYHHALSILMIDIDNFKHINDKFGHPAGDKVLKKTAEILNSSVRKIDTVARFGGDEFVIVAPHTGKDEAQGIKERILQTSEESNLTERVPPFTLSVGLHSAEPGSTADILVQVDTDLYREKDQKGERELQSLSEVLQDILDGKPEENRS